MSWQPNLYKRLKLVDEDELHRLIEKQIRDYNPNLKAMADRKIDMQSVFDRKDLTPEEKLLLIEANQQRFTQLQNKMNFTLPKVTPNPFPPVAAAAGPAPPPAAAAAPLLPRPVAAGEPDLALAAAAAPIPVPDGKAMLETDKISESEDFQVSDDLPQVQNKHKMKLQKLGELIDNSAGAIGKDSVTGQLVLDGKRIENSSFNDLIKELYSHNKHSNLIGQDALLDTISRLNSPGGKWHNVKLNSLIPRHQIKNRIGYFKLDVQQGKGFVKNLGNFPPGRKPKAMWLY